MLDYRTARYTLPAQKSAAKIIVGTSILVVGLVRLYTLAFPGPCLPALVAVVSGLVFGLAGLAWYVVVRKVEESTL